MLEKITDRYDRFADSVISEFTYRRYLNVNGFDEGVIDVYIRAESKSADYEIVKLKFSEIISFRFLENQDSSSLIINEAYINEENNIITFDFFPLIYAAGTRENIDSDFIVKCKKVSFEILDSFSNGSKIVL